MIKLNWCCKQKKGIELVDPNINLFSSYMGEADKTLNQALKVEGKWQTIMCYYSCYNALYALLMKAGIKCEIHDCTIALISHISGFDESDLTFMEDLKEKRIQSQYYLEEVKVDIDKVKLFISKCKMVSSDLDLTDLIEEIKRCPHE